MKIKKVEYMVPLRENDYSNSEKAELLNPKLDYNRKKKSITIIGKNKKTGEKVILKTSLK